MVICFDLSPLLIENKSGIGYYSTEIFLSLLELSSDTIDIIAFLPLDIYKNKNNLTILNHSKIRNKILIPLPSKIAMRTFLFWQKIEWPKIETILGYCPDIYINFDWYIPPVKKVKIITFVFDLTTVMFPEFHKKRNIQIQEVKFKRLNSVSKIITISNSAKHDLIKYDPTLIDKISILYPGLKKSLQNGNKANPDIRGKYKIYSDFILTVGTIEPRKNIIGLIEAFISVKDKLQKKLVIVGGLGWKESQISDLMEIYKNDIYFLGYIPEEDLNSLYNYCHSFVYISFYEGFGIPALEALSYGKNVLVSNNSSLPEAVNGFGIMVNPSSKEDISEGLIQLVKTNISDSEKQERISHSKKFSYDNSAKGLLKVIKSL